MHENLSKCVAFVSCNLKFNPNVFMCQYTLFIHTDEKFTSLFFFTNRTVQTANHVCAKVNSADIHISDNQ